VVEGGANVNSALSEQKSLITSLEQKYADADNRLKTLNKTMEFLQQIGVKANQAISSEFIKTSKETENFGRQLIKAREEMEKLGKAQDKLKTSTPQGTALPITAASGQAAIGGNFNQIIGQQDLLRSRFERSAQALTKVKEETDKATGSMRSLQGASLLTTSILTKAGVPGAEAISVIFRQFAEEGLTIDKLLTSKTFAFGVISALVIGSTQALKSVADDINASAQSLLKAQEQFSRVSRIGQQGGSAQAEADLRKLERAQRDVNFERERGNAIRAAEIARTEIGGGASEQELGRLQNELRRLQQQKSFAPAIFGGPTADDIRKAQNELTAAIGGNSSPQVQDALLAKARRDFSERQLKLLKDADPSNVFNQTFNSLQDQARTTGRTKELKEFIDTLKQMAEAGALGYEALAKGTDKFKQSLEDVEDLQKRISFINQKLTSDFAKVNKEFDLARDFNSSLAELRKASSDNPLARVFEVAKDRQDKFMEKFSTLSAERIQKWKEENKKVLELDIFKANFGEQLGIFKLGSEISKLGAFGVFGNTEAIEKANRDRVNLARLREARETGNSEEEFLAKNAISGGIAGELQAKIRQARDARQLVKVAELENELDQFTRSEAEKRFGRSALDQELQFLNQRSLLAKDPQEQRLVLDKILELTNNLQSLNSDQRNTRLKSLQQRLALGEAARQKVIIEINNRSDLATTRTEEILGPEPTPQSGSQTSPASNFGGSYRNDY
jgi:hypothetical protein